jgi:adenosylmethionine---8-amino-7-oxononanoate aminotransferase
MAIQYWWNIGNQSRTRILALNNSYHGDTFGAMSVSDRGIFTQPYQNRLFEVVFTDPTAEGILSIEHLLPQCACVIYEPLVQGAGGMKMYSPSELESFIKTCRSHGIICIADEVMTGFGRTGKLFASQHCPVAPDIICLSKGLTGGTMALGVTACTDMIHQAFVSDDKLKTFFHGHSFTANPIACAAALASLELFDKENTLENIERITSRNSIFRELLLERQHSLRIKNVRQTGTIVAFEVDDKVEGYTSNIKDVITEKALALGVYLRPLGNTVYIMPPYCITDEELEVLYNVIVQILEQLKT